MLYALEVQLDHAIGWWGWQTGERAATKPEFRIWQRAKNDLVQP